MTKNGLVGLSTKIEATTKSGGLPGPKATQVNQENVDIKRLLKWPNQTNASFWFFQFIFVSGGDDVVIFDNM